jgi:hypothetical protein
MRAISRNTLALREQERRQQKLSSKDDRQR